MLCTTAAAAGAAAGFCRYSMWYGCYARLASVSALRLVLNRKKEVIETRREFGAGPVRGVIEIRLLLCAVH